MIYCTIRLFLLCLQEMRLELDEKQDVMRSLQETANRLCQENHPAKQSVEVSRDSIQRDPMTFRDDCLCGSFEQLTNMLLNKMLLFSLNCPPNVVFVAFLTVYKCRFHSKGQDVNCDLFVNLLLKQ